MEQYLLDSLKCPLDGSSLKMEENYLVSETGKRYPMRNGVMPLLLGESCSVEAKEQQLHYNQIAEKYLNNLDYPHTQEYMSYLDREFLELSKDAHLGQVVELCCGSGEAFELLGSRVSCGIGVDVSTAMLDVALQKHGDKKLIFIQADVTMLPLKNERFDSVFILGGIHHVNDRRRLFQEVFRILKSGGKFYYREPVSDFFLWRWLRHVIYKISPALDEKNERPLLYSETVPLLEEVGFQHKVWKTYGFFGYCLLMNSDVLVFNRIFRYIPYIRLFTKFMVKLDDFVVRIPILKRS